MDDKKRISMTEQLEQNVKDFGMWDEYLEFIKLMEGTASIKYAHVPEEKRDAFMRTCKYSFCAGVVESMKKHHFMKN